MEDNKYTLWVLEEDGSKTEIKFEPELLVYFSFLQNAYEEGFRFGEEIQRHHLDGVLWQFIHDVYQEHHNLYGKEGIRLFIGMTMLTSRISQITLADLYQMLRILDYYISPLMNTFVIQEIVRRLLATPVNNLALMHPKVKLPSTEEATNLLRGSSKINKVWGIRRLLILAIVKRYVVTNELVDEIMAYLPDRLRILAVGNHFLMVITAGGLFSSGKIEDGQRGLTTSQLRAREEQMQGLIGLAAHIRSFPMLGTVPKSLTLTTATDELGVRVDTTLKDLDDRFLAVSLGKLEVIFVTCGAAFTMVLTTAGVFSFGRNANGELGVGNTLAAPIDMINRVPVEFVTRIWCGPVHTVAMSPTQFYMWGTCYTDKSAVTLNQGNQFLLTSPVIVKGPFADIVTIAPNVNETLVLTTEGHIYVYDKNGFSRWDTPILFKSMATGFGAGGHFVFLSRDGEAYGYGKNDNGQLGMNDTAQVLEVSPVLSLAGMKFKSVMAGYKASFFVQQVESHNLIYACGNNNYNRLGHNGPLNTLSATQMSVKAHIIDIKATETAVWLFSTRGLHKSKGDLAGSSSSNIKIAPGIIAMTDLRIEDIESIQESDSNKKRRLGCYFCGSTEFNSLALQQHSQRIFCLGCDTKYNQFNV